MARRYLTQSGELKTYTKKQQREITMQRLGLDPESKTDNKTYKSIYNDLSRRTRQYSIQQKLETNLSPLDVLFDIANKRSQIGIYPDVTLKNFKAQVTDNPNYSPLIQNLYSQKLQSNTARFAERVARQPLYFIDKSIEYELRIFNNFLNTPGVSNDLETFNNWLYEPITVYIDNETGEILTEAEAKGENGLIDLEAYTETTISRRDTIKDIREVRNFLDKLSKSRANKYKRVYTDRENNIYHYELSVSK